MTSKAFVLRGLVEFPVIALGVEPGQEVWLMRCSDGIPRWTCERELASDFETPQLARAILVRDIPAELAPHPDSIEVLEVELIPAQAATFKILGKVQ